MQVFGMEYYDIVDSHLLGMYSSMSKYVGYLDINDFIQESNPFLLILLDASYFESTSDNGSESGNSDIEVPSSNNHSFDIPSNNFELGSFQDIGRKLNKFSNNVKFIELQEHTNPQKQKNLLVKEQLSSHQKYQSPTNPKISSSSWKKRKKSCG